MVSLCQQFNGDDSWVGPYQTVPYDRPVLTAAQVSSMSLSLREKLVNDRQSLILQASALEDSMDDDTLDQLTVHIGRDQVSVGDVVRVGSKLSPSDRLGLVQEVLNQNVRYTPPEDDALRPRRDGAPMPDVIDYAQTSRETLTSGVGDCEDFAILGADLLRRMGTRPEDIQVLSGTVYNRDGEKQFDHANLAVRNSEKSWDVLELVNDKEKILPATSYLQQGYKGYYFVPSVGIDARLNAVDFEVPQSETLPKSRFEKPVDYPEANLDISRQRPVPDQSCP